MKSLPREQPELVTFRIEQLHACHVRRHQAHGSVEDTAIEGVEIAFLNQQCAGFMQLQRIVWRFSYVFAKLRNRHAGQLKHDTTPHQQIGPIPTLSRPEEARESLIRLSTMDLRVGFPATGMVLMARGGQGGQWVAMSLAHRNKCLSQKIMPAWEPNFFPTLSQDCAEIASFSNCAQ